jgi:hypothetical protein
MTIYSAVVSEVVPVGFRDLAQVADRLPGREFTDGHARLNVQGPVGYGLAGAIRFAGELKTSALLPSVKVEVVISPWSATRSEVAIHPVSNLGHFDSLRANRFFKAARSIVPLVVDHLAAELPVEAPVKLALAA